jgi:hypothetical protein
MSETQLIKQILDYCRFRDLMFWRNQSGMIKTEKNYVMKFGRAGSPDIIGCYKGRFIGVECKVGKNTTTPLQEAFGKDITDRGGKYWVVYTLDDFIRELDEFISTLTL